jgi:hypothetical protein
MKKSETKKSRATVPLTYSAEEKIRKKVSDGRNFPENTETKCNHAVS